MRSRFQVLVCAVSLMAGTPVLAQSNPPSTQSLKDPSGSGCKQASAAAQPATKPAPASADGTAPGNAGSTGWSGGTGGSLIGTNPNGTSKDSKTWQPETARGLDPIASTPRPIPASC